MKVESESKPSLKNIFPALGLCFFNQQYPPFFCVLLCPDKAIAKGPSWNIPKGLFGDVCCKDPLLNLILISQTLLFIIGLLFLCVLRIANFWPMFFPFASP